MAIRHETVVTSRERNSRDTGRTVERSGPVRTIGIRDRHQRPSESPGKFGVLVGVAEGATGSGRCA